MPTNNETGPLQVHVGFYVESMGNFRATEMVCIFFVLLEIFIQIIFPLLNIKNIVIFN